MNEFRYVRNPLSKQVELMPFYFGQSVKNIVDSVDVPECLREDVVVYRLDAELENPEMIDSSLWAETFPQEGENYQMMVRIKGGGGGGKSMTRMIMMVGIMALAFFAGPAAIFGLSSLSGSFAATAISASGGLTLAGSAMAFGVSMGVGILGSMAVNALVPPPKPDKAQAIDQQRSLTGSSNQMSPYASLPRIYGKTRFSPYKVAPDYTEVVGKDTYLRCLFCFGYGPLKISELQIGNNPITSYKEVEYEIREGWEDDSDITLYANGVQTDSYSIKLLNNPTQVTTREGRDEALFDINFPGGLWGLGNNSGQPRSRSTNFRIKYRLKGDSNWTMFKEYTLTRLSQSAFTETHRIVFPKRGTYEISIEQYGSVDNGQSEITAGYLTQVRNIIYEKSYRAKGMCYLAMRIKATDQLQGNLDGVSALCESLQTRYEYNSNNELVKQPFVKTRHPAWHIYDILTGSAAFSKVEEDRVDIDSFIAWEKAYPDWYVDVAIDGEYSRMEIIKSMCSAGKARFSLINGQYCVVVDKAGKTPVAAISPRNSFGFSFSKSFSKPIHGFKVKYIDAIREWTEQEVIVYAPGYNKDNATNFEALDSYGCTDRDRAWKFGKYMLSQAFLRPETYSLSQDIENLVVNIGDVVLLSHDTLKIGLGQARVKEVYYNDLGRAVGIYVDDKFYLPEGKTYSMVVRNKYGIMSSLAISANKEETDVLYFPEPIPSVEAPYSSYDGNGDLVFIGETTRVASRCIVTQISPGEDFTAGLTLVDEAPEIHDESSEEIPPYDPMMSDKIEAPYLRPLYPIISDITSDEGALVQDLSGSWRSAISVRVSPQQGDKSVIAMVQASYIPTDGTMEQRKSIPYTGNDIMILDNVEDGKTYNVSIRYISKNNIIGESREFETFVEGRLAPPPSILSLDRQGYNITWNYPNKPKDFVGFRVYYNHGIDFRKEVAVKAHSTSLWSSPPFSTQNLPRKQLTLFIVAVDNIGNESEIPAVISFNNGETEYDNVLTSHNEKFSQGVIRNGYVFNNKLYATEDEVFYKPDNKAFYSSDDALFYGEVIYSPLEYETTVEYTGDIANAYVKLDYKASGVYKVYYRRESKIQFYPELTDNFYKGENDLFYPQDENWYLMPDKLLIGKEQVTLKFVFEGGTEAPVLEYLNITIDAPDEVENLTNVLISADGLRLPVSKGFKVISSVFLTLFGDSEAVSAKIIDKNAELGPLIRLYNSQGVSVSGTVNASVYGFR